MASRLGSWLLLSLGTSLLANAALTAVLLRRSGAQPPAAVAAPVCASDGLLAQCQARLEVAMAAREPSTGAAQAPGPRTPEPGPRAAPKAPPTGTAKNAPAPRRTPAREGKRATAEADQDRPSGLTGGPLDLALLRALGLDEREVERLRDLGVRLQDDVARAREDLKRQGKWTGPEAREQRELEARVWAQARRDFGDETYDYLRYAAHESNRVRVSGIEENSPAANAGFQEGDIVLTYDRERVFMSDELAKSVRRDHGNGTILVEVERDGRPQELYVPPGRIGIFVQGDSLPPRP